MRKRLTPETVGYLQAFALIHERELMITVRRVARVAGVSRDAAKMWILRNPDLICGYRIFNMIEMRHVYRIRKTRWAIWSNGGRLNVNVLSRKVGCSTCTMHKILRLNPHLKTTLGFETRI